MQILIDFEEHGDKQCITINAFFFWGVDVISAALLQRCWWVSASSSTFMKQSYNFLRASRSIAKTGLFLGSNGGLKMRSKIVLKTWLQRVPKWTPKVSTNLHKVCSGGVPKRDLKKAPSAGAGKVRSGCYLLHFSKIEGLKKDSFLGTILAPFGRQNRWTQGSRTASKKVLKIDTHFTRCWVHFGVIFE